MQITFSSTLAGRRANATTNYTDWEIIRPTQSDLISLFGYNSGAQQFIQLFDSPNGPTVAITSWVAGTDVFTAVAHGMTTGQRISTGATIATILAGIYYVNRISADTFYLYDTLANALVGGATGRQDVVGATGTGTINLIPTHTFVIAATDNFSCFVPVSGIGFERGITVANSSTGPIYTAGASKDCTFCATMR